MKYIKKFEVHMPLNDAFIIAQECMVDLIDKEFIIKENINPNYINISKNYFYWEDVQEDIIKFINIFEHVVTASITYEIDIFNNDEEFYQTDNIHITIKDILSYNVENILSEIDEEVNSDDVHLLDVKLYY